MNISDLSIENIIEAYGAIVILVIIVKIIYFISLHFAVSKVRYEIEDTRKIIIEKMEKQNELNLAYLKKFTTQFERIAKALEQDQEPYIIESDKENK